MLPNRQNYLALTMFLNIPVYKRKNGRLHRSLGSALNLVLDVT